MAKGGVELKARAGASVEIVPEEGLVERLKSDIERLFKEIAAKVIPMPFK
jgi:hypothetical protein